MSQELGRIDRPAADQYAGRRKLLLVPLVYSPQANDQEGAAALQNYWEQMQTQVAALTLPSWRFCVSRLSLRVPPAVVQSRSLKGGGPGDCRALGLATAFTSRDFPRRS